MKLFIPSTKKGNGTGHITRDFKLARKVPFSLIFIPDFKDSHVLIDPNNDSQVNIIKDFPSNVEAIILDSFKTNRRVFKLLPKDIVKVGLDEGSKIRDELDIIIETLPTIKKNKKGVSYSSIGFLKDNKKIEKDKDYFKNILVVFGGEDCAKLTEKFLSFIIKENLEDKYNWTIISKRLSNKSINSINILSHVDDLSNKLTSYDLVITHFGLTTFEALFRNIPVMLISPTKYHEKLAKKANIISLGVKKINRKKFYNYITKPILLYKNIEKYKNIDSINLPSLLSSFEYTNSRKCPHCQTYGKIIYRKSGATFYKCTCGLIYQYLYVGNNNRYKKDYFFNEYKESYGKTYLEDFDNIYNQSIKRVEILNSLKIYGSKTLDIGCAYGPFLKACKDFNFRIFGIDVCKDALDYCKKELDAKCYNLDFQKDSISMLEFYDIVTMWYVIEHFSDLNLVFANVKKVLKTNGIFAFSTPNYSGISGKKSLNNFLQNSPLDHYTIWNLKSAKNILKKHGFEVLKVRVTGHHPERFFSKIKKDTLFYKIIYKFSTLFKLGDTFEIYARKK